MTLANLAPQIFQSCFSSVVRIAARMGNIAYTVKTIITAKKANEQTFCLVFDPCSIQGINHFSQA